MSEYPSRRQGDNNNYRRPQRSNFNSSPRPRQRSVIQSFSEESEHDVSQRLHPWVELKYWSYNPAIFPRMIAAVSSDAVAGELIHVYDRNGNYFGCGFWNAQSKTPLRVLNHSTTAGFGEDDLLESIKAAVSMRRDWLKLDDTTNAYRIIHGDSDGIGGLIVDKYGDVLSLEITTLGVWQRLSAWLPLLHELCGTKRQLISVDERIARMEGMQPGEVESSERLSRVLIKENGITYEVNFADGHKTGFFCDQRDNRLRFAKLVEGREVLDLCCYSGGFSIAAKMLGGAKDVTAVDLDEKAIAMAKRNANLNQQRINFVHADAFTYARTMLANEKRYGAVLLDPPKFVLSRDEYELGLKKYLDLNSLGIQLVEKHGLFVTCSCSGLVASSEFEELVVKAAQRQGRKLQIIDITGPGADHPFLSTYPEGRYLKVLWARVL